MARRLMVFLLAFCSVVIRSPATLANDAQLPDPTRPADPAAAAPSADQPGATASPVLQSLILRAGGPALAVIDGVRVGIGDRVGVARVRRIDEHGVVLAAPQGTWLLRLTPRAEKRLVARPAEPARLGARHQ